MAGVKGRSGRKRNEEPFRHMLLQKLDKMDPLTDRKRMDNVAEKMVEEAENGEAWAIKELLDRIDGKVANKVENTHDIAGSLELVKRVVKG